MPTLKRMAEAPISAGANRGGFVFNLFCFGAPLAMSSTGPREATAPDAAAPDAAAAGLADGIDPAEDSQINVASLEAKWVGWSEDLEETGTRSRMWDGQRAHAHRARAGPLPRRGFPATGYGACRRALSGGSESGVHHGPRLPNLRHKNASRAARSATAPDAVARCAHHSACFTWPI